MEKSKALAAARRYAALHPHNIAQKVEIIVEHFREKVQSEIGGRAKAMVVTASRLHAIRYKQAIDKYLQAKGYTDLKALIAFSGEIIDPDAGGEAFSEEKMNGFPEGKTEAKFGSDDYQVMVVAEKYQTGFSQPLLHTMYVDKKLSGVNAVQTLSRLNRTHPLKKRTFVLDFVNDLDTIQDAYSAYWGEALAETTDPQVLYETWEAATLNAALFAALQPAEGRFHDLGATEQDEFRSRLNQFVRIYAFLSQIVSYADTDAEKNYVYSRMLTHRIVDKDHERLDVDDALRMTHYALDKTYEGSLSVGESDTLGATFTGGGMGSLTEEEKVALADVVEKLNDRYGLNLTDADELLLASFGEHMTNQPQVQQKAAKNTKEKFSIAFEDDLSFALLDHLDAHTDLVKGFMDNPEMQRVLGGALLDFVYRAAAEKHGA